MVTVPECHEQLLTTDIECWSMSESELPPPSPGEIPGYGESRSTYSPDVVGAGVPAPRLGKAAWWCGVLSIILGSIGLGIAGAFMGHRAWTYGNPRGKRARLLSVIGIAESVLLFVFLDIATH